MSTEMIDDGKGPYPYHPIKAELFRATLRLGGLGQTRGPGESYSDVIFLLASPNAMSLLLRPR